MNKDFEKFLKDTGYTDIKAIPGNRYACINRFMYTDAIISGKIGERIGTEGRWCYENYRDAKEALDAWDGKGEPDGWLRHPETGRRRENGIEYVNF